MTTSRSLMSLVLFVLLGLGAVSVPAEDGDVSGSWPGPSERRPLRTAGEMDDRKPPLE